MVIVIDIFKEIDSKIMQDTEKKLKITNINRDLCRLEIGETVVIIPRLQVINGIQAVV